MNIMGTAVLTKSQMLQYINKANPSPKLNTSVSNLIDLFLIEGEIEGVRGDIAFVQATWETNNFKFTGDVDWKQNNYAGIGTVGGGVKGHSFATPQLGVRAQIQHLKAYASKEPLKQSCVDPRFHLVTRGKSTTVQGLSGTWAADKTYGTKLTNRYNEIAKLPGGGTVAKQIRILLDPGHGQGKAHNRGYKGIKWKNEGDANYHYALILKKKLEALGFYVDLTRKSIGQDPSLSQRGAMAKGYDLFISLHTNALNGTATGVEIYEDVHARATALAKNLCSIIASTLGITNRGVKYRYSGNSNWYGVLRANQAKAGMLIEHCFHDNVSDVNKYEKNADKLAENMAVTIANYYGIGTSGLGGNVAETKEIDIMDRGQIEFIAFSDTTDKEALAKVEAYFKATKIPFVLVHKEKPFKFDGVKRLFVVDKNIKGYSKIPGQWILVRNMDEANKFYATQNNWKSMTYNRMPN